MSELGSNSERTKERWGVALPVLSYLLFRRRAQRVMPKVRDWMNINSWLVNIIV